MEDCSGPNIAALRAEDGGLPAVTEFFSALIETRCTGEFAQWGCMVSSAHAGAENSDPPGARPPRPPAPAAARRPAHRAPEGASPGELAEEADPASAADVLALPAHDVNLRSRAGADAGRLRRTVAAAITAVARGREATAPQTP
ncbi:hypothetical protein [Streptomyces sp. TRM68416]|uniref:hypothetical protein n=1 Tax=Streptomyces sp. TRM68416 TaxID=2758412 RepID=UPI001662084D|nr:hypothetical protein [Streptomyces sp. TRM68416]MBD0841426.1 hypothetical protein [Streptomyces sp. TRM68416]